MTIATEAASYIARTSVSADPMCMVNNVIYASRYAYMYIARIFDQIISYSYVHNYLAAAIQKITR